MVSKADKIETIRNSVHGIKRMMLGECCSRNLELALLAFLLFFFSSKQVIYFILNPRLFLLLLQLHQKEAIYCGVRGLWLVA